MAGNIKVRVRQDGTFVCDSLSSGDESQTIEIDSLDGFTIDLEIKEGEEIPPKKELGLKEALKSGQYSVTVEPKGVKLVEHSQMAEHSLSFKESFKEKLMEKFTEKWNIRFWSWLKNGQLKVCISEERLAKEPAIGEIIEASNYEGKGTLEWLRERNQHEAEKACLLNILAKLAAIPGLEGNKGNKMINKVKSVKHYEDNRIHLEVTEQFFPIMKKSKHSKKGMKGGIVAKAHKRLYDTAKREREEKNWSKENYDLISFRERKTHEYSLQIVVAKDKDKGYLNYVDVDLDLANPLVGLWGFLRHVWHISQRKRIDHLTKKTYEKIYKEQELEVKNFCYYKLG